MDTVGRASPDEPGRGPEAYCRGDPNWTNYLWSGDHVTLVDFEDAGLPPRQITATQQAERTLHLLS